MKACKFLILVSSLVLTIQICASQPGPGFDPGFDSGYGPGLDPGINPGFSPGFDTGLYDRPGAISISQVISTPSSSSQQTGTTVDYHVQSKADTLEGYVPLKIHFWDESTATQGVTAVGFEWDLGDGSKESKKDFTHVYSSPGTFKVTPKVKWSDGKASTGKSATIRVYSPSGATVTGKSGALNESQAINATVPEKLPLNESQETSETISEELSLNESQNISQAIMDNRDKLRLTN
jgi:PKD repeat protein